MRSSVDLPQPDGPTKTMNSPCLDIQIDAVQNIHRAVGFADIPSEQRPVIYSLLPKSSGQTREISAPGRNIDLVAVVVACKTVTGQSLPTRPQAELPLPPSHSC